MKAALAIALGLLALPAQGAGERVWLESHRDNGILELRPHALLPAGQNYRWQFSVVARSPAGQFQGQQAGVIQGDGGERQLARSRLALPEGGRVEAEIRLFAAGSGALRAEIREALR